MASTKLRTAEELERSHWAEKYTSVAEGQLYTGKALSPFPIHEYLKMGLLGKQLRMLEMNAGHALVEHMVADTLTDMTITIGEDEDGNGSGVRKQEQEIREWMEETDFDAVLEEACRDFYSNGYSVTQPFRTVQGEKNDFTVVNLKGSTWYPDEPALIHQPVVSGRIIDVFPQTEGHSTVWYAFVERHTIGKLEYELYQLDNCDSLEGAKVALSKVEKLAGLNEVVQTDLDQLAIFQKNRQKRSGDMFGQSVFVPIWDGLQEISEFQTQIRQERIKHFRSRLAVPTRSLQKIETKDEPTVRHSKNSNSAEQGQGAKYNANQDLFPIPEGATVLPQYIRWDMEIITVGSQEIDKIHTRLASYAGFPKSVFNLDDIGDPKVDTEKRKNARYVRKIIQGQRRMASLVKDVIVTRGAWLKQNVDPAKAKINFASPFDLTQDEVVDLMKKMNPEATLVSEEEAMKQVWKNKTPEEREEMMKKIEERRQITEVETNSALNKVNPIL